MGARARPALLLALCALQHDTKGVWIGDGSAFPAAVGVNPMVPIMTLAHRTAEAIAGSVAATSTGAVAN